MEEIISTIMDTYSTGTYVFYSLHTTLNVILHCGLSNLFDSNFRIEELSKLNYSKDVELQKQRQQLESMQVSTNMQ